MKFFKLLVVPDYRINNQKTGSAFQDTASLAESCPALSGRPEKE